MTMGIPRQVRGAVRAADLTQDQLGEFWALGLFLMVVKA